MIGVDLKKDLQVLEAAYNDARGVTAAFNLNLLAHLNRRYDAGFDLSSFSHVARYNSALGCIQMFLESRVEQSVVLGGERIEFARGELLHTENSYKYAPEEFARLARSAGFGVTTSWRDANDWFAIFLLQVGA